MNEQDTIKVWGKDYIPSNIHDVSVIQVRIPLEWVKKALGGSIAPGNWADYK